MAESSSGFKKLAIRRFPKVDGHDTSESRFWSKYKVWGRGIASPTVT